MSEVVDPLAPGESCYRVLAEMVPHIVAIVDRALRVVYINERGRTYFGRTAAELNDPYAALVVHNEDLHLAAGARSAIAAGTAYECAELRLRRMDGAFRRHAVQAVPLPHSAGVPDQWVVTATNTEDRRLSDKIIGKEIDRFARTPVGDDTTSVHWREANRLRVMTEEMASIGHYRIDLASNEAYWSDVVYTIYGLPKTFTPTLGWVLSAYHVDDRDRVIDIIRQTLADGATFRLSARIVRPDGTIREVVTGGQAERTADGKISGLFGVVQDVTSMKDGERERERLSERVMLAARAGSIGIWEWNIAANRLEWDNVMYTLHGIDDRTTAPTYDSWIRCIYPCDRELLETEIQSALDGESFNTEFRVIWPTGEIRHLRSVGTLIHDRGGSGSRLVGANWDITEVRLLTDDLRKEKERALEASSAKSEFLAKMSHEIRTPMNGIIGFTTLILDEQLSIQQRRYATLLRDAGHSLLAIINDILDFSKLEAGKIQLENIPIRLDAVIDGALSMLRIEASPKGIIVSENLASDLPVWVSGDPTRLRQTLLNLLTNALKFTERGSIRISVRREPLAHADALRFEIADTGIGISPEQQHLLFHDFSQLEKSTTRRYGGTGLGLAISKRLVEAMGGSIGVDSERGAGSVFWFTARLPEVASPSVFATETTDVSPPRHILIADDNRVNQIVVQTFLERDGHTVVLVDDGAQAVDAVRAGGFDLVLMDMQMPVMDGVEATRAIRALPGSNGALPIVAVTANAMIDEIERCRAAGMNDHLAKPIERDLLRRAVARWTCDRAPAPAAPTPAAPAAVPALGIAMLLEIFDGDGSRVVDLLDSAIALIGADRIEIERCASVADMPSAARAAHRIKGTSGSIGSTTVMVLSAAIEQSAKQDPEAIDAPMLAELDGAIAVIRAELETYRGSVSAMLSVPSAIARAS